MIRRASSVRNKADWVVEFTDYCFQIPGDVCLVLHTILWFTAYILSLSGRISLSLYIIYGKHKLCRLVLRWLSLTVMQNGSKAPTNRTFFLVKNWGWSQHPTVKSFDNIFKQFFFFFFGYLLSFDHRKQFPPCKHPRKKKEKKTILKQ